MRNIVTREFHHAWLTLLSNILGTGRSVTPRGQPTKEVIGAQIIVEDARANVLVHPVRNLNYRFMVAEWLWIVAGRDDVAGIAKYNQNIAQFSDDGATFAGAYGPRLAPQWPHLEAILRTKEDSRQAVASIWTPCPAPSKDVPCTLTWQLLRRGDRLHGIVTMRSSDIWLGLPYDFFNFSMMQNMMAGAIGCQVGSLTFQLGSSHLYVTDHHAACDILDSLTVGGTLRSPRLPDLVDPSAAAEAVLQGHQEGGGLAPYHRVLHHTKTRAQALEVLRAAAE